MQNPLQQYFRQPKIYISLPSKGIYNKPETLDGNIENMPVYGMTGMDEILMHTPDALMTGQSTIKVIESCCPSIKDASELSSLDLNAVMAAIRIATFGNIMTVPHTCSNCKEENEYDINLSTVIDHYSMLAYQNVIKIKDIVIKIKPLTYSQVTNISIRNFQNQQKLFKLSNMNESEEKSNLVTELFQDMALLKNEIYSSSIESVEIPNQVVTDPQFIKEWVRNCDKSTFDIIKERFDLNSENLRLPSVKVKCKDCDFENLITIELDESNFFE